MVTIPNNTDNIAYNCSTKLELGFGVSLEFDSNKAVLSSKEQGVIEKWKL